MEKILARSGLDSIHQKVINDERLDVEDGTRLFATPDLAALGYLANIVRERKNGNRAYYVYNQHINYSNVCINGCRFCAFQRKAGEKGAYRMTVEEIAAKVK